jgi:hypothetical protein
VLTGTRGALTLVGKRDAMVLVTLGVTDAVNPVINGTANGVSLGRIALRPPASLPPTEAGGAPYRTGLYSAEVPASWIVKGLNITVSADNYLPSGISAPPIGAATKMELNIIPFYLFGASDANSLPLTATSAPSAAIQNDMYDKWPISELLVKPFNGGRVSIPMLPVSPRTDRNGVKQPAYMLSNMDQQKEGYAAMNTVLDLLRQIREANGESRTNNLYYGPMITLNAAGRLANLGGGLGGNGGGVGDTTYGGIFIHELGHAFGLPHANDGYNAGTFPYLGGSTKGSAWGYNQRAKIFLNLLIDRTAQNFTNCATSRQTTTTGVCYKQDPMQGGAEDRTAGYTYGTFSDFNTGKMQEFFEGRTTQDGAGRRTYSGGVLFPDSSFASGYSRWDAIDRNMVEYVPTAAQINDNLPVTRNVPVYTIMISYSNAGTPGVSMIYAPFRYTGNLLTSFDPSKAQDMADFNVDTGKYASWCKTNGCDYTVKVTYADGSVIYRVLQGAFRPFNRPVDAPAATATDPLASASFNNWAINVPGDKVISTVEMLHTPTVWRGFPASPVVLLRY